ncbi:MAG: hypothetical protein ACKOC6_11285, partial [bacterium]
SDTPGLRLGDAIVPSVTAGELPALLEHPEVVGGMRPKLRAVAPALAAGVGRVHLCAWQGPDTLTAVLAGTGTATTFHAASEARTLQEESHV